MFLGDPMDVPLAVVAFVAGQLGIADASCVKGYGARPMTAYQHQWDIRRDYGYGDFTERAAELRRFVEARAWLSNEGPRALFDRAMAWCVEHKVLLPGVTTMARMISGSAPLLPNGCGPPSTTRPATRPSGNNGTESGGKPPRWHGVTSRRCSGWLVGGRRWRPFRGGRRSLSGGG